jgi:hypothetical protein
VVIYMWVMQTRCPCLGQPSWKVSRTFWRWCPNQCHLRDNRRIYVWRSQMKVGVKLLRSTVHVAHKASTSCAGLQYIATYTCKLCHGQSGEAFLMLVMTIIVNEKEVASSRSF